MVAESNSRLLTQVLQAILTVAGRRTYDEFAVKVLSMVVFNLQRYFEFLKFVSVSENVYVEDTRRVAVDASVDSVESAEVGRAIERILRNVCMELGDEALLYFITEIKEHLGETSVEGIERLGVDLNKIQADHHLLYSKRKRKIPSPIKRPKPDIKKKKPKLRIDDLGTLEYTWNDVDSWKYDNQTCMLHRSDGSLLDTLRLDDVVESYINSNTKYKEETAISKPGLTISEKEYEFLETLYARDMDISMATGMLDVSDQKLGFMVDKFLRSEMLERISDTEVKLTQKGIVILLERMEHR